MPVAIESLVPSAGDATDRFLVRRGAGPLGHTIELLTPASVKTLLSISAADVSGLATVATTGQYSSLSGIPSTFAPSAHTHPASQINDSTAAGRSMLTAADAAAQTALLNNFTSALKGLVPGSGGGTTNFLRADGTWAAPPGGGGGSPGGSTTQLQYNNAGAFAGASSALIEGNEIRLPSIATPTAPAASGVKVYGRAVAGRVFPAMLAERGEQLSLQPSLTDTKLALWVATGNNGTDTNVGFVAASTGTSTAVNWASTNFRTRMRWREWLVTVATTTAVAGFRGSAQQWTVGGGGTNGTPGASGGFYMQAVWSPATGVVSTHRAFFGMLASVAAPTDVNPSTLLNMCGMGYDSADTNIQFMVNDGAGTATKTDLGASFPKPSADRTKVYQIIIYSPPGSTQSVHYTVRDLETGAEASGSATTDLPGTTTALNPYGYVSVGGVSSVIGLGVSQITVETEC